MSERKFSFLFLFSFCKKSEYFLQNLIWCKTEVEYMLDILIKAFGFILIIVIGFLLKSKGICKREHGQFLSTIIMNITLPCALLS